MLLHGSLESFLLIVVLTGTPATIALFAWPIRYAIKGLTEPEPAPRAAAAPSRA